MNLNKFLYIFALSLTLSTVQSIAQSNIQTLGAPLIFSPEASFLNPSYLKNTGKFHLSIIPFTGGEVNISNNIMSAGDVIDLVNSVTNDNGSISFAPIHSIKGKLKSDNYMMGKVDATLLHAGFRLGSPDNSLNLSFSIRQHVHGSFFFNDELFKLLMEGNKQFTGKTVSLKPNLGLLSYTDFSFAGSKSFSLGDDIIVTPGARVRYLLGNISLSTKGSSIDFYTAPNGEYVELRNKIDANLGGMFSLDDVAGGINLDLNNLKNGLAGGMAFDLGVTVQYNNLSLSLAAVDNGFISFKDRSSWNLSAQNNIHWDGYDVIAAYEGENPTKDIISSLDLDTVRKGFNTGIGSKLTFNGNWGFNHNDDNGSSYYTHNVGLNYIQGLNNQYGNSIRPMYSLYYQFNFRNRFSAGANIYGFGNIQDFGINIGGRLLGVNVGMGTNSMASILNMRNSKQFNLFGIIGLNF